jgi:carbon storage regulator
MLVLSRKPGESIKVDENIIVTIVEIRGDKVRLGIDAPKEVKVHRQEVADAIAAKLTEASSPATESATTP